MPKNYTKKNGTSYVPDENRFLFNVDTLYYSANAKNYMEVMASYLMDILDEGKLYAELNDKERMKISLNLSKYENEIHFEIMPFGKTSYTFQIRNNDFAFYFMRKPLDNTYPIYVHINQFKLWKDGVIDSYIETQEILARLGFDISECKPSRIDLCCHSDQYHWTIKDLQKLKKPKAMANPTIRKVNPETLEFETCEFGRRNNYQLRIYNKSAELFVKNKFHFLQVYKEHGLSDTVWNIEIELHRKYLKNILVDGKSDFFDDMDNLLSEKGLSILWTDLMSNKFVHDSPFWRVLQKGREDKFYQVNNYISRVKEIDESINREIAQIYGRLVKFVLNENLENQNAFNRAISKFYELALEYEEEKGITFDEVVNERKRLFVSEDINKLIKKIPSNDGKKNIENLRNMGN